MSIVSNVCNFVKLVVAMRYSFDCPEYTKANAFIVWQITVGVQPSEWFYYEYSLPSNTQQSIVRNVCVP